MIHWLGNWFLFLMLHYSFDSSASYCWIMCFKLKLQSVMIYCNCTICNALWTYIQLLKLRFCDRILWYGRGLHQMSYVRGESRFSDHRPVYSIFLAEVESINHSRFKRRMSCSSSRIEVEELLPYSYGYGELNFFRDMEQYWVQEHAKSFGLVSAEMQQYYPFR